MLSRPIRLTLLCLAAAMVVAPLAIHKPGLPGGLRSDEPAYYLMGLSLGRDFDLRCERQDLERLFEEFPYDAARNVILMTDDGWNTIFFGKPFVYSLLAAPFARLFGANGFVALNMALLAGMIALGTRYLARFNSEPVALLFSAGFFLLSTAPAYAFWIHPEIFNMAAICACLYLGLTPAPESTTRFGRLARARAALATPLARLTASGALLALAAYNKPVFAALGLPVLLAAARRRGWREAATWCVGALLAGALLAGISVAFTGHPSAYLGVERAGVKVEAPGTLVGVVPRQIAEGDPANQANSWTWLAYWPKDGIRKLPENLLYFVVGRHTGLFPYLPFSAFALLLFLAHGRRSPERWALVAALGAVGLFFLLLIDFNWHGGGGFIGNRYFVSAYPGFLFLVTRIAPAALLPAAWALAALLTVPLQLAPFGAPVVHPTLQWHVRNPPFGIFPLELSLERQIPGYRGGAVAGAWIYGRKDVLLPWGNDLFVRSHGALELWLMSDRPLADVVFDVASLAPENRIRFEVAGVHRDLVYSPGADGAAPPPQRLEIPIPGPSRMTDPDGQPIFGYRMVVEAEHGFPFAGSVGDDQGFMVGARLVYFGTRADLDGDVYRAEWVRVDVPPSFPAARRTVVPVVVKNASAATWWARGGGHVALAYHWLAPDGSTRVWDGARTMLAADLAPGESAPVALEIDAPSAPGDYELVLDPVREQVAWFSSHGDTNSWRRRVTVVP